MMSNSNIKRMHLKVHLKYNIGYVYRFCLNKLFAMFVQSKEFLETSLLFILIILPNHCIVSFRLYFIEFVQENKHYCI